MSKIAPLIKEVEALINHTTDKISNYNASTKDVELFVSALSHVAANPQDQYHLFQVGQTFIKRILAGHLYILHSKQYELLPKLHELGLTEYIKYQEALEPLVLKLTLAAQNKCEQVMQGIISDIEANPHDYQSLISKL